MIFKFRHIGDISPFCKCPDPAEEIPDRVDPERENLFPRDALIDTVEPILPLPPA
jgi:hypothetical protein